MCVPTGDTDHDHTHTHVSEPQPINPGDRVQLEEVDSVTVTLLVDNTIDVLMTGSEVARRAPVPVDFFEREHLISEHGYSVLVTITKEGHSDSILYDAGLSRNALVHNMDVLEVRPEDIRAIVMSHGHADHHGGLEGVIKRIGRKRLPMILHPDIWLTRKVVFPTGAEINLPPPNRGDLEREEVEIVEERGPSLLLNSKILVTGQVERTTDFEKGFPPQRAFINGSWQPDQWVWDDQGVVVNVKNRGLVVLSSCSHAGSINVMRHARNITGVEKIYAFMGGMHLTGAIMEPLINPTLEAMADIKPDYVIPGHCTGWKAMHRLSSMLPEAYIQPSVGTRFQFS